MENGLPHFERWGNDNGQLVELIFKKDQISHRRHFFLEKVSENSCLDSRSEMLQEEGGFTPPKMSNSWRCGRENFYTWPMRACWKLLSRRQCLGFSKLLINLKPNGKLGDQVNIPIPTKFLFSDCYWVWHVPGIKNFIGQAKRSKTANLIESEIQRIFPGKDDKILSGWNG